jgi:pyrroline-5-carboxylate reductase
MPHLLNRDPSMNDTSLKRVAVVGGGNLGQALARGWVASGLLDAGDVWITRRHATKLEDLAAAGFKVGSDNRAASAEADCIVIAVQPAQMVGVLEEIADLIENQVVISVATGVTLKSVRDVLGEGVTLVRAMPNTAVETMSSMTCLAADDASGRALETAQHLFDAVGLTLVIDEEMMTPATALCACGIAFFLRTIRAAAQGGTEIGFHADDALTLAAQTARGAADLILSGGSHPESEIDRVTTPRGCTIAGLNELEHQGFSSAMIRGILTSSRRAEELL